MNTIKLTTSAQTDSVIASGSTKTLIDTSVTSALTGHHAIGATAGRSTQTVMDVSQYRTVDLKGILTNITGESYASYRVYLYKSAIAKTGTEFTNNPDELEMYDIPFSTEGFVTIDTSQAQGLAFIVTTLRTSDTFTALAIGSQRDFNLLKTTTETVNLLGELNEKVELANGLIAESKNSQLLKSTSVTSAFTGYHAVGSTVGRGSQTVLDVRGFSSVWAEASKEVGSLTRCSVYLYDTHDVETGSDLNNNPNLISSHEILLTETGEPSSAFVNTNNAQGMALVFSTLGTGETGYARLIGCHSNVTQRKRETIWDKTYSYDELFNESGEPLLYIASLFDMRAYTNLKLEAVSNYGVPLTIRVIETDGGSYATARYAGDAFTKDENNSTLLPALASSTTLRFPIHQAITLLNDGMRSPQIRVEPTEGSVDTARVLKLQLTGLLL